MEHHHVLVGELHLLRIENVAVLQADVVILVEEAFALHAGHVEHVKLRQHVLHLLHLAVGNVVGFEHAAAHIIRDAQLLGGDEHEIHARIARERLDERMHGAAEFEVAAKAHGEVFKPALAPPYGEQVREGLRRVLVAAVARVDDGHVRAVGGNAGRALLGVAHNGDVRIAGDGADGIRDALAFGNGAGVGLREADHLAAEAQHGSLKAEARTGARLIEQRCEQLAVAGVRKTRRIGNDLVRKVEDLLQLGSGHVHGFQNAFPFQHANLLS